MSPVNGQETETDYRPRDWSAAQKWAWLLVGGPICALWTLVLWLRVNQPQNRLNDFVQEWTSARNWWTGHPIYWDMDQSIAHYFNPTWKVLLNVNAHPPASVLLVLPFGRLEFFTANWLWNWLSLALIAPTLWLLMRSRGLSFSAWSLLPILTLVLTSNSLAQQVNQGQLNLLLLFLLTWAWALQRDAFDGWAGALIGIAAAVKVFPAFLGLYFLMQRRWRGVLGVVIGFVAMNAVTGAVLGWQALHDYAVVVVPRVSEFRDFWSNASIAGFWSKAFEASSGHSIPIFHSPAFAKLMTLLTSGAVTVYTGWRSWKAQTLEQRDAAFALTLVAMLLVSPITWDHYFLLLVPAAMIYWRWMTPTFFNGFTLLLLLVWVATIYPKHVWDATLPGDGELVFLPGQTATVATPLQSVTWLAYQFYGLVLLFLFLATRRIETQTTINARETSHASIEQQQPSVG
ncbi:MAG: glycosyltransferase family 87 protein [Pirellulaceae bacterium]